MIVIGKSLLGENSEHRRFGIGLFAQRSTDGRTNKESESCAFIHDDTWDKTVTGKGRATFEPSGEDFRLRGLARDAVGENPPARDVSSENQMGN